MSMSTVTRKSRIARVWEDRIESGVMTKSQCQQFARVVALQAAGYQPTGHRTNLTYDEALALYDRIEERGGVRLTPEHTEQGLAWLRRFGTKKVGLPDGILDRFSHFTYDGHAEVTVNAYGMAWAVPFWTIHLTDGSAIEYFCNAWQSGNERADWYWVTRA